MKKELAIAITAFLTACTLAGGASAQTAVFSYTGVPTSPVNPGESFTLGINLVFTAGGNMTNVAALSYWLWQPSPDSSFPLSITNRDASGSVFDDLISTPLIYPQQLDPINRNPNGSVHITDLGALELGLAPLPSGTYYVASLTFAVSPTAAPGTYVVGNTTAATPGVGGRISVANDNTGHFTVPIADSRFSVSVVPEPATWSLLAIGLCTLMMPTIRRFRC